MALRGWTVGLIAVAGLALWLLLASPPKLLGIDTGNAGMALLIGTAWISLYALSRMPRGQLDRDVAPGEWKAWIGTGFMGLAVAYFLSKAHVFAGASIPHNPDAAAVGRNLVMLLVAWTVLSSVIGARWKGEVQEDERDREIAVKASGWGRAALVFCIVGIAVMLSFSPADRLQWATHFMIANLLVFSLMWGCLVEYAATAIAYWRDRH